ncbi:MAG: hypothetical protein M1458_03755 [Deltaproteobacteria bacterium]|nr:hypothetical protein [Deltaproteobacteria bacterium]
MKYDKITSGLKNIKNRQRFALVSGDTCEVELRDALIFDFTIEDLYYENIAS